MIRKFILFGLMATIVLPGMLKAAAEPARPREPYVLLIGTDYVRFCSGDFQRMIGRGVRVIECYNCRLSADLVNNAECVLLATTAGEIQDKLSENELVLAFGLLAVRPLWQAPGLAALMPELINHPKKALIVLLPYPQSNPLQVCPSLVGAFGGGIFQLKILVWQRFLVEDNEYHSFEQWLQHQIQQARVRQRAEDVLRREDQQDILDAVEAKVREIRESQALRAAAPRREESSFDARPRPQLQQTDETFEERFDEFGSLLTALGGENLHQQFLDLYNGRNLEYFAGRKREFTASLLTFGDRGLVQQFNEIINQ